jgi:hypothetical protein
MRTISGDFLAIDRKSRARTPSLDISTRPVEERVCDFNDVVIAMDAEQAMSEASRCVQCPDPAPCMIACPTHNDIPSAMWLIEQGRFLEAAEFYRQTSSLPEICGRVCPQEQLCQGSCSQLKSMGPVLTGALEAFVVDYQRKHVGVNVPAGEPNGKRIAIIGAGPAGLACAEQLAQKGYEVTIFESKPAAGGLLTYGIPNFKLPKEVVFARIEDLEKAGVKFVFNTYIGQDMTIDNLMNDGYQAVFVGVGTEIDAPMEIEGEDLPGVYKATEFLMRCNVDLEHLPSEIRSRQRSVKKLWSSAAATPPLTVCALPCAWAQMKSPACTVAPRRKCPVGVTTANWPKKKAPSTGSSPSLFASSPAKTAAWQKSNASAWNWVNQTRKAAAGRFRWKTQILSSQPTALSPPSATGRTRSSAKPPQTLRPTSGV